MPDSPLPVGVYERLLTAGLDRRLGTGERVEHPVDAADAPQVLADHVRDRLLRVLETMPGEQRVAWVNRLLAGLADPDPVLTGPRQLWAVTPHEEAGAARLRSRPVVPLSRPALLTNAPSDPQLGAELRAELATADRVDLLCAFVKWHGLRVLERELAALAERGAPLRVVTTTYLGATDRRALDRLVRDFGATVAITYETRSTRLHAKAWLLRRNTGYDTAYVGSSNLSRAALLDGLEWNVKLAGAHTPELLTKFAATFDSYWHDPAFVGYDPDTDADRLDEALRLAGGAHTPGAATFTVSGLAVRPYPHQEDILARLAVERDVHHHHRNLVVAATGTGKTVIAALDYARMPGRPRLLFVAHRAEILQQSLRTYREVLADASFGELYLAGERPRRWGHVFASVQSLTASGIDRFPTDHFDVVVIDEFHHAEAATYRRLLDHLAPRELLGLTATPERSDGLDVRDLFGGRTAAELRLWDALDNDLLCPFHYFGVSDGTDLSQLGWRRGDYDTASLERVYTADDARVRIVLRELADKVSDLAGMRALGFCVSVAHAQFMAARFTAAGIPARAVSGASSPAERRDALQALRERRVAVLFAVDLFTEGLDVPDVDTLLLLRPTQSATVFLQQLGRGLRRTADKAVLTVLDFIGLQRREFRFDLKYRALTGASRASLQRQLERGFAFLPSGCELVLDPVAARVVLDNVSRQLRLSRRELVADLRSHGDLDLATWLTESSRELSDVLRFGSWTALRRAAGLPVPPPGPAEDALLRRVGAFAHVDDPERGAAYLAMVRDPVDYGALSPLEQMFARMLFFSLWPDAGGLGSYQEGLDLLARHPAVRAEIASVVELGLARAEHRTGPLEAGMSRLALRTGARYSREEILAGIDYAHLRRAPKSHMTGVVWSENTDTDALMVTLRKTETDYSPTTMYRDYAISPELFHWESQNTTSAASGVGQRYQHHRARGSHVLLLARETRTNDWGGPHPYVCLGPASYTSHVGERPMAITWHLRHPMAQDTYRRAALTA